MNDNEPLDSFLLPRKPVKTPWAFVICSAIASLLSIGVMIAPVPIWFKFPAAILAVGNLIQCVKRLKV